MRKIMILGIAIGLALLCNACLLQPSQPASTTTVIPIQSGGDSGGIWAVLLIVVVGLLVAAVIYAMNQRGKAQVLQDREDRRIQHFAALGQLPTRNGQPYLTAQYQALPDPEHYPYPGQYQPAIERGR